MLCSSFRSIMAVSPWDRFFTSCIMGASDNGGNYQVNDNIRNYNTKPA